MSEKCHFRTLSRCGSDPSGKDRDLGRSEASVYSQAHSFRYIKKLRHRSLANDLSRTATSVRLPLCVSGNAQDGDQTGLKSNLHTSVTDAAYWFQRPATSRSAERAGEHRGVLFFTVRKNEKSKIEDDFAIHCCAARCCGCSDFDWPCCRWPEQRREGGRQRWRQP